MKNNEIRFNILDDMCWFFLNLQISEFEIYNFYPLSIWI